MMSAMIQAFDIRIWVVAFSAVIVGIVLFLRYLRRNDDYWKIRGVPFVPRHSYYEIIKIMTTKQITDIIKEQARKYGSLYGAFEFSTPFLVVSDPEHLKNILIKDFHIFNLRREVPFGNEIVLKMVSILKGEDWKRVRSLITPAFTTKKMKQITNIIKECTKTTMKTFEEHIEKGKSIDIKRIFGAFTMDVIASAAYNIKIDSYHDVNNSFVVHARNIFEKIPLSMIIIFMLMPQFLIKWLRLYKLSPTEKSIIFFREIVLKVIEQRKKEGYKGNDFLQLLLDSAEEEFSLQNKDGEDFSSVETTDEEDHYGYLNRNEAASYVTNKKLSHDEIVAQCVLFFIVGYETTASTMGFVAYNLALNPECQEKLIEEVDQAFSKQSEILYDVIREMKYLDCVISETLRMYPPLLGTERTATADYKLGDTGIYVTRDMIIHVPIYAIHYDENNFEEPEKFKPERFMDKDKIKPYTYLPFGHGPRNCLGMRFALMEMKTCLFQVLRHFRFKKAPETPVPIRFNFTGLLNVSSLPLSIEKRLDIE